jgi:MFS family permease
MAFGQFLLSAVTDGADAAVGLFVGVFVVGWCFGALFWAMPTLVMELFGAKHFGANRGFMGLSPAIGGYLLSTVLAGRAYEANAGGGGGGGEGSDHACVSGAACYHTAWVTNATLSVVAVGLCAWLNRRRERRRGGGGGGRRRRRRRRREGVQGVASESENRPRVRNQNSNARSRQRLSPKFAVARAATRHDSLLRKFQASPRIAARKSR